MQSFVPQRQKLEYEVKRNSEIDAEQHETPKLDGPACVDESSVPQSAVKLLDRLSRRIQRQATDARRVSKIVGKTDSDYYFGIAEGLDRAGSQLRCEYLRAKAMQSSDTDVRTRPAD